MAESRALGEEEKVARRRGRGAGRRRCATSCCARPTSRRADAPDGAGEADNVVLRTEGYDPDAYGEHQRVPHWDFATELGLIDGERAVKISGSMFTMYKGWGARLLRALVQLSLDRNADAYTEVRPPTLVRTETMIATGHLPKFAEDGVPDRARRPLGDPHRRGAAHVAAPRRGARRGATCRSRYMAYTSCFRREAGSAGRDTRGLLRSHEFDKVELFALTNGAEQAIACQEDVLARSESILPRPRPRLPGARPVHRRPRRARRPAPGTSRPTPPAATSGSR